MRKVEKYGTTWTFDSDESPSGIEVKIEMGAIRRGGRWTHKSKGKECGMGLSFHLERMRQIVWPELDSHRWHNICRDEIASHKIVVLMGAASTGKSHTPSWIRLCQYFSDPDNTCVLVSSTHIDGLRLRIWAEIVMLWSRAVERFPFLPGHLIDSKLLIATDDIKENDIDENRMARDWRKGIKGVPCIQNGKFIGLSKFIGIKQKNMFLIADECFPAGTMVDTENGKCPIENILPGDLVMSATGINRVSSVSSKLSKSLVRLNLEDGRKIVCTDSHPFLTQKGWKKAFHLRQGEYMVSQHECVQILRSSDKKYDLLRQELRREMGNVARATGSFLHQGKSEENRSSDRLEASKSSRICRGIQATQHQFPSHAQSNFQGENYTTNERGWMQAKDSRRERHRSDSGGVEAGGVGAGIEVKCGCGHGNEGRIGLSSALQTGHWDSGYEVRGGGGRSFSQNDFEKISGCEKDDISFRVRLDSVEVLQQEDIERLGGGAGGIEVYNLEVEGHPSYSVNGLLVHNCQLMGPSFLSACANLENNENFNATFLGNPNDTADPLGKAAEPRDGWAGHMAPEKTECWDTRFMNGRCVNLVGTDSPNFDEATKDKFKYLINGRKIANTLSFFPKDSVEYYSNCVGVMKVGILSRTIVTAEMCRHFDAMKDAIWSGHPGTRIMAIDAAYGGDRCVAGHAEFGESREGGQILKIYPPVIVPVTVREDMSAEDQIATYCKEYGEENSVPPEHLFHDATGRGSLGTSLARIWSNQCNPVEFGGKPSKRPVSLDLFIVDEETGERRLKRCDEHYDYFVAELAFSVRYVIEGRQLRNLPSDVMEELCLRKWDNGRGGRKSVEPKTVAPGRTSGWKIGFKQRIGHSPDLADWLSIIIEGARRLGFEIKKLGKDNNNSEQDSDWFQKENDEYAEAIEEGLLVRD